MRTRWRRLLDVDDAEHLCGVAELFNLDGAHINSFPSKVRPLCERCARASSRLRSCVSTVVHSWLRRKVLRSRLPLRDLAYLIVRIVESFLNAEFIIGEEPDIAMVELAVGALLGHQDTV
ncbi:MAG: QsdR family transcriptional regulator [Mycobacterium sp.]